MAIGTVLSIISICIGLFFSSFALFFSLKNNKKSDTKDIEQRVKEADGLQIERVKETTEINLKLDFISKNTQEIKNEISSIKDDVKAHHDSIIKLDENVKSLKHRMDEVEEKVEKYHG